MPQYREMQQQCTALTSLSLVDAISLNVLSGWHLLHLRSLRAYTHPPEWLAGVLRQFPSLTEVTLAGLTWAPGEDELLASVRQADKRGMETILLRYGQTFMQRIAPSIRSLRWLSFSLDQSSKMKTQS